MLCSGTLRDDFSRLGFVKMNSVILQAVDKMGQKLNCRSPIRVLYDWEGRAVISVDQKWDGRDVVTVDEGKRRTDRHINR